MKKCLHSKLTPANTNKGCQCRVCKPCERPCDCYRCRKYDLNKEN